MAPEAMMLDGLDRVWRAAETLAGDDGGLRRRLKAARGHLLAALERPEQWPPGLLAVARCVERTIRERHGADPLEAMPPALARQTAEDILALAADVCAAFRDAGKAGAACSPEGDGTARGFAVYPAPRAAAPPASASA